MGKYGQAAIEAVKLILSTGMEPTQAWEITTKKTFGNDSQSKDKGCPKGAFLGLCEYGLVKGIPIGNYTSSQDNKKYAVRAARILKDHPEFADNENLLWQEVIDKSDKKPNNQMDVAISLFKENLLKG